MKSWLIRILHWLRQPTTLYGISMLVGGAVGAATGALSEGIAATLISASVPLLFPDNSTARTLAAALVPPAVAALEKRATAGNEPRKPG